MVTELTSAGLSVDTQQETLDAIEADQKGNISNRLDLSTSSPLGQVNRLFARAIRIVGEALSATYAGMDPDSATGDALDRLSAVTGTFRLAATKSTVTLDCDLDAGTYPIGTLISHVAGRPADRFVNANGVTSTGGSNLVAFEAETAGLLQAPVGPAGTYVIAGPVAGWNSVGAATSGNAGANAESDAALRVRRADELENPGSTSAAGIAADISQLAADGVTSVISVQVLENDTDVTVDTIPPHALEAVVFGPSSPTAADDQAVADQIYASKAGGIGTAGSTSVTVTDSQGIDHLIRFTRPANVTVPVSVTIQVDTNTYEGDTEVEERIEERIQDLPPGVDVTWSAVASWTEEITGVNRITGLLIDGISLTDKTILPREKAQPGTITITSSAGSP